MKEEISYTEQLETQPCSTTWRWDKTKSLSKLMKSGFNQICLQSLFNHHNPEQLDQSKIHPKEQFAQDHQLKPLQLDQQQ